MTDHLSKEKRSWNMSKIRSKNTRPELAVRKYLYSNGFRYRLHNRKLPGKPDITNQSKKTAVFVNGCFWHQHEGCKKAAIPKSNKSYWLPKLEKNVARFNDNTNKLLDMGWKVFIVWECETKDEDVLKSILDAVYIDG
jgi:DNA mismatch endonuclease (patch repair protein)|tara:strand:- start:1368 stop:1781 length:414 start_codon:yes stop_codon:yes gene_type:complete